MIITAYKSEADGKIFEDKKKYQAHLRKLARHRLEQKKLAIVREQADAVWNELYEREQSLDDWAQMVIDEQDLFWAEAARFHSSDWEQVGKKPRGYTLPMPCPELLEFAEFSMDWSDSVSNSHSCPHNGVTCWGIHEAKDGRPRGYPGWTGRIEWLIKWPEEWDGVYLGADLFGGFGNHRARARAHTGSGGGGGMRFSEKHKCHVQSFRYDFKIFAADWPGMARYYQKRQMWNKLADREFA